MNPLVLNKEYFKAEGVPTLFTCKMVFYGHILWAPSPSPRVPILFDLSAGVTGPRGTRGCHLLQLAFFIHLLVGRHRGAFYNEKISETQQSPEGSGKSTLSSVNSSLSPNL